MNFDHPWLLWTLPLALLPLLVPPGRPLANAWVSLLPRDRASDVVGWLVRLAGVLTLAALVIGLAGPYRPEYGVERVGKGAEIVLVLDRSRSMDQGFAANRAGPPVHGTGPEAIDYYSSQSPGRLRDSKGKVARQLLADFTASRPDDRFGMIVFSTLPLRVLEFTQKNEVVQAAINAGNIGRGLSETNIGLALEAALSYFDERAYSGSRIIMLVSDGGDRLEPDMAERIAVQARKQRVAVYWLYLRSANSPGLMLEAATGDAPSSAGTATDGDAAAAGNVPELVLHRYFQSLGMPYRAYEASNPEALQKAIAAVGALENLPIAYIDTVPRRDLGSHLLAAALAGVLLLLAAEFAEIKRWV